ncbi:hypothetical protein AB0J14_19325 [Micromonospora arborensis]|uniref:LppU/SCO3897 family protein n=1 Tax=Micromonospora arborensis TaxID=2116518 RepID=UPI0033F72E98
MSEQVAPPPAADAAPTEPAVEKPQPAEPPAAGSQSVEAQAAGAQSAEPPAAGSQPAEAQPAEQEAKKPKKALKIVGAVLVFAVVAGLKFGVASAIGNYFNKDETADAKAGDCIAELPEVTGTEQETVDGAKVVECTSTDAAYSVVGRVNDQNEAQAKADTTCEQYFKEGEQGYIYSSIEPGKTGYVLCLTKKA